MGTPSPSHVEPKPNVFLVGAPRCGTTALAHYLGQHPDVFVPYVKEPHFFGSDLTNRRGFPSLRAYLKLFEDADARWAVDGSTWYLYSRRAAREIHEFNARARILIMVRNPVELLHSWHAHAVLMGSEPITGFADALAAEPERRAGRLLPRNTPREQLLYREIPRFSEQIERYLDAFGAEQVKIVVHDDFVRDNHGVVGEVCRFLGIDDGFRPEIGQVNVNARPRSRVLQTVLEHQPTPVRTLVRTLTPKRMRHAVRDTLRNLNSVPTRRQQMDAALERALVDEFAPEVQRLSLLLDRDLRHWSATR